MENLQLSLKLISHLSFTMLSYQLLNQLFDWSKMLKGSYADQQARLRVFLMFLSMSVGFLTSSFILTIIDLVVASLPSFSNPY